MMNTDDFKKENHKILSLPNKGFIYLDDKTKNEHELLINTIQLKDTSKYCLKFNSQIINLLDGDDKEYFSSNEVVLLNDTPNYFLNLSVIENLEFYSPIAKKENLKEAISKAIMLTDLEGCMQQKITSLNIEEYYLFVLACAIVRQPKIIVIDDYLAKVPETIKTKVYEILEKFSQTNLVVLTFPITDYTFNNYQPISKHHTIQNYIDNKETVKKEKPVINYNSVTKLFIKSQIRPILTIFILFFVSFFSLAFFLNKIDQARLNTTNKPLTKKLSFYQDDKSNLTNVNKDKLKEANITYEPSYKLYSNITVSIIDKIDEVIFDNVIVKKMSSVMPNSKYDDPEYKDGAICFSWDFLKYYKVNDEVTMFFNLNGHAQELPRLVYKVKDFYRYGNRTIYLNNYAYETIFINHTHKKLLNDLQYSFTGGHPKKYYIEIDPKLSINQVSTTSEISDFLTVYLYDKELLSSSIPVVNVNNPRDNQNDNTLYISQAIADNIKNQIEIDRDIINYWHYECTNKEAELSQINQKLINLGFKTEFINNKFVFAVDFFLPCFLLVHILIAIAFYFINKKPINHLVSIIRNRHLNHKLSTKLVVSPMLIGYFAFVLIGIIINLISIFAPSYSLDLSQGCNYSLLVVYPLGFIPIFITQLVTLKKLGKCEKND